MKVLEVSGRKGGVGTTTVACALALALSKWSPNGVLLIDTQENGEAFSVLCLSAPTGRESASIGENNLTVVNVPLSEVDNGLSVSQYEFVVIDAGKTSVGKSYFGLDPFRVAVVRNSYLSLRAETLARGLAKDAVVSIHDKESVLTENDTRVVLGVPSVTVFALDNAVARAIDAGLFSSREHLWDNWTRQFIRSHGLVKSVAV
jgi:hypothetical protein